jgi:hypothetical protein
MKRAILTLTMVLVIVVLGYRFGSTKAPTFNSSVAIAAPVPQPAAAPAPVVRCGEVRAGLASLQDANKHLLAAQYIPSHAPKNIKDTWDTAVLTTQQAIQNTQNVLAWPGCSN